MLTIALATCRAYPTLPDSDRHLQTELQRLGIDCRPAIWDDPEHEWGAYDLVVIRSCWDYHKHHEQFRAWIDRLDDAGIAMLNPPDLVRWNMDKRYLRDLTARGVVTVPTVWLERGDPATLADLFAAHEWDEVVIKPAVSASAHGTWRVTRAHAAAHEDAFRAQLGSIALLAQPFLRQITTQGEWSLVYIDGEYSHALNKRPKTGDFRVQEEHGGTITPVTPDDVLLRQSRVPLEALARPTLYARVDGVVIDGAFHLMELELIEPELYTALVPGASARFAAAIAHRLG